MGPFLGDELPVPAQDGVGSDERGNFREGTSAALIIGQPESSATALLFQDSILLAEILYDCVLLAGDPAGHGGDENLPRR